MEEPAAQVARNRWGKPRLVSRGQIQDLCSRLRQAPPEVHEPVSGRGDAGPYAGLHEVVFWALPGAQRLVESTPAPHGQALSHLPAEALLLLSEVTGFTGVPGTGSVRALSWRYVPGTTSIQLTAWADGQAGDQPLVQLQCATVDATEAWDLQEDDVRSLVACWWLLLGRPQRATAPAAAEKAPARGVKKAPSELEERLRPLESPGETEVSFLFRDWTLRTRGHRGSRAGWHGPAGEHLVRSHMRLAHVGPGGKEREFRPVQAHTRSGPHRASERKPPASTIYVLDLAE